MKNVTRNIDPDSARDLLAQPPRACISFAADQGPLAQPVTLAWRDARIFVGLPAHVHPIPAPDQEVVLLVDEGVHWFDLRAIYLRGQATSAAALPDAPAGLSWFEVVPLKTVAWDYGALREVDSHDA